MATEQGMTAEAAAPEAQAMVRLEIRTGMHRGARVPLTKGLWHIGSAEAQSRIVLADDSIQPQHLALQVSDDGVEVTALAH
jgi:hypothetical protein